MYQNKAEWWNFFRSGSPDWWNYLFPLVNDLSWMVQMFSTTHAEHIPREFFLRKLFSFNEIWKSGQVYEITHIPSLTLYLSAIWLTFRTLSEELLPAQMPSSVYHPAISNPLCNTTHYLVSSFIIFITFFHYLKNLINVTAKAERAVRYIVVN